MQRENSLNSGIYAIPAFPPPLRGRDREERELQTPTSVTTPLPTPPPQGGREQTVSAVPLGDSLQS